MVNKYLRHTCILYLTFKIVQLLAHSSLESCRWFAVLLLTGQKWPGISKRADQVGRSEIDISLMWQVPGRARCGRSSNVILAGQATYVSFGQRTRET